MKYPKGDPFDITNFSPYKWIKESKELEAEIKLQDAERELRMVKEWLIGTLDIFSRLSSEQFEIWKMCYSNRREELHATLDIFSRLSSEDFENWKKRYLNRGKEIINNDSSI